MSRESWQEHAACTHTDPELFFPTAEAGTALARQVAAAKQVCASCPVRPACLSFALVSLPYGVAGGLTAAERADLRAADRPSRTRRGAA